MSTQRSNAQQIKTTYELVLTQLENTLGCDYARFLHHELQQTVTALRLLVEDSEQPIWGIVLADLDEQTRKVLSLFRVLPRLNMTVDDEPCIALAEWIDYLQKIHSLKQQPALYQQEINDRKFLNDVLENKYCDDLERLENLLSKDLAEEGLVVTLEIKENGFLQATISRDGLVANGALWKWWSSSLSTIVIHSQTTSPGAPSK